MTATSSTASAGPIYRLGRYPEAVAQLEQAATLRPNDPEINDHLGDAYWQVGRKLEAHFQWNVASSLDTDGTSRRACAEAHGRPRRRAQDGESAPSLDDRRLRPRRPAAN